MLILAHAVVPHHHHNKVFVAIANILNHDAQDMLLANSCPTGHTIL